MWRSMNYGARISAPNDLFWRAALVTSGNLQWRAALWSVTAEMAARYPQHMAIRSKYLASTMDDDVTKELREQGVPPVRQWQNLSTRKREDLQCNNHAIEEMITRLVIQMSKFFKIWSIWRQHYAIDSTIVFHWLAIQSFVQQFDSISQSINYGNAALGTIFKCDDL